MLICLNGLAAVELCDGSDFLWAADQATDDAAAAAHLLADFVIGAIGFDAHDLDMEKLTAIVRAWQGQIVVGPFNEIKAFAGGHGPCAAQIFGL